MRLRDNPDQDQNAGQDWRSELRWAIVGSSACKRQLAVKRLPRLGNVE